MFIGSTKNRDSFELGTHETIGVSLPTSVVYHYRPPQKIKLIEFIPAEVIFQIPIPVFPFLSLLCLHHSTRLGPFPIKTFPLLRNLEFITAVIWMPSTDWIRMLLCSFFDYRSGHQNKMSGDEKL